jgi:hypothetical protein
MKPRDPERIHSLPAAEFKVEESSLADDLHLPPGVLGRPL